MKTGEVKAGMIVLGILSLVLIKAGGITDPGEFTPVDDLSGLVEKLNTNSAKIETIQSPFIQKKQLNFLDETIISKGAFWFKKENNLKWAYKEPFEYVIIINGGKFLIKDGEQISAFDIDSNPAFKEINDLIIGMVQGNIMNGDKFEVEAFENNLQYLVKLVPRDGNMKEIISIMEIYFNREDMSVYKVIMKENENDYTEITFIDNQINEAIADSLFSTDL